MIQQYHTGMARYFLTLASLAAFAAASYNFEPEHVQVIEDVRTLVHVSCPSSVGLTLNDSLAFLCNTPCKTLSSSLHYRPHSTRTGTQLS